MGDVEIVEVAPRDGLQNERVHLPTAEKVELINRLAAAGARRIEAVSFVSGRVPQMRDAEAVLAGLSAGDRDPGVARPRLSGLVLNARGLERALSTDVDEINYVIPASDTFSRRNQGAPTDAVISEFTRLVGRAHDARVAVTVTIATAFGCPFEGEVATERVVGIARRLLAAGVDELAVADTIGVAVPADVRRVIDGIRELDPGVPLRAHFHNTRNTGYANAIAAIDAGVSVLDASSGGVGGCPFAPNATGNIATEDLLYLLSRTGYATGLDPLAVADIGTWLSGKLGYSQATALMGRAGWFPPAPENGIDQGPDGTVGTARTA
jgi:hydroxymethylglutaryl-CoA lyase